MLQLRDAQGRLPWRELAKDLTAGVAFVVFTIATFWMLGQLADAMRAVGWLD